MTQRATISDVAKLAGVGKVTVSYVLNGRAREHGISEDTSRRIQTAAAELNYTPNALGRALARRRTDTVAVVFQGAHYFAGGSNFISELLQGVCQECVAQGFEVMLHTRFAPDFGSEADYLASGRIDGALLLRDSDDPLAGALIAKGLPVVAFFMRPEDSVVPYVDGDNFAGGRLAAQHLLGLGHRRFAMLTGPSKSVDASDRRSGFEETLRTAGLTLDPAMAFGVYSPQDDYGAFVEALRRTDRPTGLFCWSDDVAFKAIQIASSLGMNVPRDLSVIGYDGTAACANSNPPLTSVRQPINAMASQATRMLSDFIRGDEPDMRRLVFPPQLEVRASTAPPALISR